MSDDPLPRIQIGDLELMGPQELKARLKSLQRDRERQKDLKAKAMIVQGWLTRNQPIPRNVVQDFLDAFNEYRLAGEEDPLLNPETLPDWTPKDGQ